MASLSICDEAPMANKAVIACVDETCRRVMHGDELFGGKVIILVGDFRQTCPVIRNGLKAQVVDASIRSWAFWDDLKIYHLTRPCRNACDPEFQQWVDRIGDGAGPHIDLSMLKQVTDMQDILDFTFPIHVLANPLQCLRRSILAPTNRQVDMYNTNILKLIHGEQRTYMAADCLKEVNAAGMVSPNSALDYVSKQTPPGLPPHTLTVKVNGVYRLIRNFSVDRGLVKNV